MALIAATSYFDIYCVEGVDQSFFIASMSVYGILNKYHEMFLIYSQKRGFQVYMRL